MRLTIPTILLAAVCGCVSPGAVGVTVKVLSPEAKELVKQETRAQVAILTNNQTEQVGGLIGQAVIEARASLQADIAAFHQEQQAGGSITNNNPWPVVIVAGFAVVEALVLVYLFGGWRRQKKLTASLNRGEAEYGKLKTPLVGGFENE